MNTKWNKIWNNRTLSKDNISILEKLIIADGFDSGAGNYSSIEWLEYSEFISNKIGNNINSIYEVGCGSGAFLYNFYKKGMMVGGIDYSKELIKIANEYIINSDFICNDAIKINTTLKYDCLISHSVFQYFETLEYAENVINKMIEKSNKQIIILDINDLSKKEELENLRKGELGEEEYNKKYKGLEHMYYDKTFFYQIAKKNNLNIELFYTNNPNYLNGKYRFNVKLTK